jgi:hypothetical protein
LAKDFTIVLAHRGNTLGLWATVHSCEIELAGSDFDYNYVILQNGMTINEPLTGKKVHKQDPDFINMVDTLSRSGKLKQVISHPEALAPPTARQYATVFADGDLLFFFDNHCLVAKDYFARAVLDFKHYPIDLLHSATRFYAGDITAYHYRLQLEKNFWADAATFPQLELKPYKIAAGGHGGFIVRREVWEKTEGYWRGFKGYGGEEMYYDLKLWQLGYSVWLDPRVIHYHYAGVRGYARHYTDEYYINMMACANIIGGYKWMEKVYSSFNTTAGKVGKNMFDLCMIAQERSQPHADYLAGIRKMDLDELLRFFDDNGIPVR